MMWGYGGGAGAAMMLLSSLILVGLLGLACYLIYRATRTGSDAPPRDAEDVLRERYARGEIDEDEFQRRLDHLRRLTGSSR